MFQDDGLMGSGRGGSQSARFEDVGSQRDKTRVGETLQKLLPSSNCLRLLPVVFSSFVPPWWNCSGVCVQLSEQ
jgi:hypothetical protein